MDAVRRRYGTRHGRIVVYPAITHPHKNHAVLLDRHDDHARPRLALVLLGGAGAADAEVGGDRRLGLRKGDPHRPASDADRDALIAAPRRSSSPASTRGSAPRCSRR